MIENSGAIRIIKDFYEAPLLKLIKREIKIPLEIPIKRAITIIGPRRAGKTYLMFQMMHELLKKVKKEQILYINFEGSEFIDGNVEDLDKLLESFYNIYPQNKKRKIWLFLDEIQNIARWESFVRRCLDKENVQIFISGSSSKILSKEIASSLRGRSLSYFVLPFSFEEFLLAHNIKYEKYLSSYQKSKVLHAMEEFIKYGGYPEAVLYSEERERILREIVEITLYRDVIERYKIKNIKLLKILMKGLIESKEFSFHKFYNFLRSQGIKVGKNTLYNYVEYLNDVFFVFPLRKFSYSYKETEQSIPKIYLVDNGVFYVNGIRNIGKLIENSVFIEFLRKKNKFPLLEIYYWKDSYGREVDFVLKEGMEVKELIQVCYNIDEYGIKEREIKGLLKASKELKCGNLLVITWDYEGEEEHKGKKIKFVPLWKFLLGRKNEKH